MSQLGTFNGTIDATGYHLPPGTITITWTHPSFGSRTKVLRPETACNSHLDLLARYGEGDPALNGWQTIPAISGEAGGGEIYALVEELYRRYDVGRFPTEQEWCDFGFANFPSKQLVSPADARRVLPDYMLPTGGSGTGGTGTEGSGSGGSGSGSAGTGEVEIAALKKQLQQATQVNAELTTKLTALQSRVALTIPADIAKTMKELPTWEDIPRRGGRLLRIKAAIKWLNDEVARRSK